MNPPAKVQIIENADGPEYAVLPMSHYEEILAKLELLEDIRDFDNAKAALDAGVKEMIPSHVVARLLAGESPVKVWREYRGMTQEQLATAVNLTSPYISQIESGAREGKVGVYVNLAKCLGVDIDDLVTAS